ELLGRAAVGNASGQFHDDFLERCGVKDAGGFAQGAQGGSGHAEFLSDLVQRAGLLDAAEAGQDRVEEIQQHQSGVVIEEELAVAGRVTFSAEVVQTLQQRIQKLEVLEAL